LGKVGLTNIVNHLTEIEDVTIQSMFLKAIVNEQVVDNTTNLEVSKWLEHLKKIQPKEVMIYTVSRDTPLKGITAIPISVLKNIADKVEETGMKATIY
jgi:hypothetical protein